MKLKRMLAVFLCAVMLLSCVPAVWAADDACTVLFLFANGYEMQTVLDLSVQDGTAEAYGFVVAAKDHAGAPIETVTAMDVLVAAHKAIYGDAFTPQSAGDYLVVENSFMTKAFGLETSNLGFTINDATPHDNTYIEGANVGYYTGYAIDTARVQNGDRVALFTYKDAYWSDIQPVFDCPDVAAKDQPFTVCVRGYSIMYYGCDKQEAIDENTNPLAGSTLECTQDFKTFQPLGRLDGNGELSVTLPQSGTWYLVVRGVSNGIPLIASYKAVTVPTKKPLYFPIRLSFSFDISDLRGGPIIGKLYLVVRYKDLRTHTPDVTKKFLLLPIYLGCVFPPVL
ncbi:MAG: hypothetical protein IJT44_04115 [Clostridia bacterium]|nr:hypothetical protein [Clostridia bacterium]